MCLKARPTSLTGMCDPSTTTPTYPLSEKKEQKSKKTKAGKISSKLAEVTAYFCTMISINSIAKCLGNRKLLNTLSQAVFHFLL